MNTESGTDATIIEKQNIGASLVGESTSFVFHSGGMLRDYDKALVAVVNGEEKAKQLLDLIESDSKLSLNNEDKAFICTVPFQRIRDLELLSANARSHDSPIKVSHYLAKDRILPALEAHQKEEAIKEIAALLSGAKQVVDVERFVVDVLAREKIKTTGIGDGVAIPHARTHAVKALVIALGRSSKGVEFNSVDGKPASLIFLIGTPKGKDTAGYLRVLAHLSRLLMQESFRYALFVAPSPEEIVNELKKVER
ncbi:MAG: PTS sugar transporter subunit IIA [Planctomycetota bacterium]|jgi:PTS system fructose-specific IIC component